jgi:dinuclear metal center YbgI/SA1388 family protein
MASLAEVADFMDGLLGSAAFPDYSPALNGVQVETGAEITHLAAAVDVRERTIEGARACGARLLLVHHGLFWAGVQPIRGAYYRRLRALITSGIGLYSAHLPLDAHPEIGNNVLLARELGLRPTRGFARFETIDAGVAGDADVPTADLVRRAEEFAGAHGGTVRHTTIEHGRVTRRWAICTGAGAERDTLDEAAAAGVDTLIVGEGPHWTAIDAEEQGLAVIYAGHYATEVLGIRALAERAAQRFSVPWTFIDAPTGL